MLGHGAIGQFAIGQVGQPTPSPLGVINCVLSAIETGDGFLGGVQFWNRVISGEIGIIEAGFTGAEIGVIEQALSAGASGVIEQAAAAVPGSAAPVITSAHISIRMV